MQMAKEFMCPAQSAPVSIIGINCLQDSENNIHHTAGF